MTHFDTIKKKPACELCVSEIPKSSLNKHNIRSLDEAAQEKEKNIHDEIKNIENETKNYWQNQLKMKTRISDFSQNQKDICHEEWFANIFFNKLFNKLSNQTIYIYMYILTYFPFL